MDFLKDLWLHAGAAGVLVPLLVCANWLQWKRAHAKDEQSMTLTREIGEVAARGAGALESMTKSLDGNTNAIRELSLLVAGRGHR